jgi:hypothetical protein
MKIYQEPKAAPTPGTGNAEKRAIYKPRTESWSLDSGEKFSGTADLVATGKKFDDVHATYDFATTPDHAPYTGREKLANVLGTGIAGAAIGAAGGGVVSTGLALLGGIGDFIGTIAGGHSSGMSAALVFTPIAIGAAIGFGVGAHSGYKEDGAAPHTTISGLLHSQDNQLLFYPNGRADAKVNLTEYATAKEVPHAEMTAPTTKGKAMGTWALRAAALPASSLIPLLGLGISASVGHHVGKSLDRETPLGATVGTVAGLGITVGTYASIAAAESGLPHSWIPLAALQVGTTVAGALLGPKIAEGERQAKAAELQTGGQWWSENAPKEAA